MKYKVFIERDALKSLKKLPDNVKGRIKETLRKLEYFPKNLDVVKLSGTKRKYRIRVGNYRIIIELHKDEIYVIDILPRKDAYKDL